MDDGQLHRAFSLACYVLAAAGLHAYFRLREMLRKVETFDSREVMKGAVASCRCFVTASSRGKAWQDGKGRGLGRYDDHMHAPNAT